MKPSLGIIVNFELAFMDSHGKKAQRYLEGLASKKISAECHMN